MQVRRFMVLAFAAAWSAGGLSLQEPVGEHTGEDELTRDDTRPNVVMVMLDDMSSNLLQYMNVTTALVESSVVFDSYVISTPLCCPSRATIQTGKCPHNSKVHH